MPRLAILAAFATALVLAAGEPARAGTIHPDVPTEVDPSANYMIYLHGAWPETHPLTEPHPKRGLFEYEKIVTALAESGFEVITELRQEKTNPRKFARTRVLGQVNALIAKGVPPERITVAGFSKGAQMSLVVAALAKQPKLNIVNMGGCGKGQFRLAYDKFLEADASKMQGRMLSMFDQQDRIAGTCKEAAEKAPGLNFEETVLEVGAGHGTFYQPRDVWISKIADWVKAGQASQ